MLNRNEATISNVTYLLNFRDRDEGIRFQQAKAEESFRGIINQQSEQSNLPDNIDPAAARISFKSGSKNISISQIACQLNLSFPNAKKIDFDHQWEIIAKNVKEFYAGAINFKSSDSYAMTALIYHVQFRSNATTVELNSWIYDKFIKKELDEELASVAVKIGFKREQWYLNLNVGAYELRNLEIRPQPGQAGILLDLDKVPVTEKGIDLTFDVNNRPKFLLANQTGEVMKTDAPDILLEIAQGFTAKEIDALFV